MYHIPTICKYSILDDHTLLHAKYVSFIFHCFYFNFHTPPKKPGNNFALFFIRLVLLIREKVHYKPRFSSSLSTGFKFHTQFSNPHYLHFNFRRTLAARKPWVLFHSFVSSKVLNNSKNETTLSTSPVY